MKISTRQVAMCAMLTALALGLSTLENLFPVTLFIPLPGVKLGPVSYTHLDVYKRQPKANGRRVVKELGKLTP